jgi:hypothetical protein
MSLLCGQLLPASYQTALLLSQEKPAFPPRLHEGDHLGCVDRMLSYVLAIASIPTYSKQTISYNMPAKLLARFRRLGQQAPWPTMLPDGFESEHITEHRVRARAPALGSFLRHLFELLVNWLIAARWSWSSPYASYHKAQVVADEYECDQWSSAVRCKVD